MIINLQSSFFEKKCELITHGKFKITAFKYPSGVEALLVEGERLSFVFTPFKGQQIWHLKVDGKEISMKTSVEEPKNTSVYLQNYGGFLYHCGIISFGAPDAEHPQHGELPNVRYDSAYIECGEDECGKFIALGGSHEHDTAFIRRYRFSPTVKLYEDGTVLSIKVKIENLRAYPLEYAYLCHVNFLPFEGATLIGSSKCDKEHVTVYGSDGSKEFNDYLIALSKDLTLMNKVGAKGQCYDPELCFGIEYEKTDDNRGYTLQDTGNGACYVSHPTDVLPYSIRWISRTANESAMGMCLPATGEHLGYENAKAKGQLKILPPNSTLEFEIEAGWLDKADCESLKAKIENILR